MEEMGDRNSEDIPDIRLKSGLKESPIVVDSAAEAEYNEIYENEHLLKFTILEHYCNRIKAGDKDFRSLYLYGQGGSGKSHTVKTILSDAPGYEIFTGKVQGYLGLVRLLHKHKEGKILVIDDSVQHTDLKNPTVEGILKVALDPEPPNRIILSTRSDESSQPKKKLPGAIYIELSEQEKAEFEREFPNSSSRLSEEENELVDFESQDGFDLGWKDFEFKSVIVFITNYSKVPQALKDRCWILEIVLTNAQMLDIIDRALIHSNPEADELDVKTLFKDLNSDHATQIDKINLKAYMLEQDASGLIEKTYSFRLFKRLLSLYMATKHTPLWKTLLALEVKS